MIIIKYISLIITGLFAGITVSFLISGELIKFFIGILLTGLFIFLDYRADMVKNKEFNDSGPYIIY